MKRASACPTITRAEIEDGALANKAADLAWAADPIELFFLQIQGSGRVRFPDGSVMRIGYADQNGREYVAVGRLLRERNILPPGGANMQAIKAWMRANPDQGRALMRENLSYIFFRELTGPGAARGAQRARYAARNRRGRPQIRSAGRAGLPRRSTGRRPTACGSRRTRAARSRAPNRFDTFWGRGTEATQIAGGMSANGVALILRAEGRRQCRARAQP